MVDCEIDATRSKFGSAGLVANKPSALVSTTRVGSSSGPSGTTTAVDAMLRPPGSVQAPETPTAKEEAALLGRELYSVWLGRLSSSSTGC